MRNVIIKLLLVIATLVIVALVIVNAAKACDYGTELDPRLLNTDYIVINEFTEPVSNIVFSTLANRIGNYPQFVIVALYQNKISCYWYLNKEYKLEVYAFNEKTRHWGKSEFDPETERKITDGLLKLQGISSTQTEEL